MPSLILNEILSRTQIMQTRTAVYNLNILHILEKIMRVRRAFTQALAALADRVTSDRRIHAEK